MDFLTTHELRDRVNLDETLAVGWRERNAEGATRVRDGSYLDTLKATLAREGFTEPILVERTSRGLAVLDGTHRIMLAAELGITTIPVRFTA